jgi:hypothetical protein
MCSSVEAAETDAPIMIAFGGDGTVRRVTDAEPHLYVPRGGVPALCADRAFWRLLAYGPVVCAFADHREASAIIEAFETRRWLN